MEQQLLYLGTSGLVLPYKNKGEYPAAFEGESRLHVYGRLFNSLEVNSIFYKIPRASTICQWRQSVGSDFRFTFKLWKQITHNQALDYDKKDLEKYFAVISEVLEKRGCILIQFPPSVKCSLFKKVALLLSDIKQISKDKWPIAVEFRCPSWYREQTYQLLNEYRATMVFHDKFGSESPPIQSDVKHVYVRFHGPNGDYKGSYDQGFLFEYAGYIGEWLAANKTVYVYFNNTMGAALDNLRMLETFLKEKQTN